MRRFKIWGILSIALAIVSCQKPEPELVIDGGDLTVAYGEEFYLQASVNNLPEGEYRSKKYWRSSDETVVRAFDSNYGTFYACGIGEAVIYVDSDFLGDEVFSLSASCHVTVVDMEVTSLELDTTSCVLFPNDKIRLFKTYEPSNASFPEFYWSSSDKDVAMVNSEGEVSAVNIGECTITVKEVRSGLTAQCQITVVPVEMTSLKLSKTNCSIEIGKTHSLVASFEPDSVTFSELYWHSSDENIATVSNGIVSAVGIGDCVISVTNADNSLTAQCNISVYMTEITSISCAAEETMEQFGRFYLEANLQPINATRFGLRWHSSDESVASVDEFTGLVCCAAMGECTITISNIYNSVTAECHLTVIPIPVESLSLSKSFLYLPTGYYEKIYCWVEPLGAHGYHLKWESSNTSVVTVAEDGTVTAVGEGIATIKVTELGSGCTAECSVVVGTAGTEEEYVQDYIANNVSIKLIGSKWHESLPIMYFTFVITNNGNDTVYLKSANNRKLGTIDIKKHIEPGDTYEIDIPERELTWLFIMHNIMETK